jgi:hypothetical protein
MNPRHSDLTGRHGPACCSRSYEPCSRVESIWRGGQGREGWTASSNVAVTLSAFTKLCRAMSSGSSTSTWSVISSETGPAQAFVNFVNASPTPYHAVHNAASLLEKKGFIRLNERESWKGQIKPNGRYYVVRNHTSLVGFAVGGAYKPGATLSCRQAKTNREQAVGFPSLERIPTLAASRSDPSPRRKTWATFEWASRLTAADYGILGWTETCPLLAELSLEATRRDLISITS